MEYSFRWYGPEDPVSLSDIRQTDANGIVTSLHQIPSGEVWSIEDIESRISLINKNNTRNKFKLKWNVVESIPVHNNIKLRKKNYKILIENFKKTIMNIGKNKINTICYNFMPVIDWTRTELNFRLPSDALALRFDIIHMLIFEKFILQMPNIDKRYSSKQIDKANKLINKLSKNFLFELQNSIMGGLPAAEKKYDIKEFKSMINEFKDLSSDDLKSNLKLFLKEIIPVAEEFNIKMCIHPDDPPMNLFDLPRIVSNEKDLDFIFNISESKSNCLTFCAGSLASSRQNDVIHLFTKFAKKINFIHLRNIKIENDNLSFYESDHLNGDINFVKLIKLILNEELQRNNSLIPMRPDHGHRLLDDQFKNINPGYSAIGRLKGLAQIKGIAKALEFYNFL